MRFHNLTHNVPAATTTALTRHPASRRPASRRPASRRISRTILAAFVLAAASAVTPAHAALLAPSVPNLTDGTDSGTSWTDNITNFKKPTFTGTGLPLTTVKLFTGATEIGSGLINQLGQWTITANTPLVDGVHTITAKHVLAGQLSGSSALLKVTIDTVAPVASKADMAAASDSGISSADNVTKVQKPVFQGTATPGARVVLSTTGGGSIGSTTAGANGAWTVVGSFPAGTHSYVAVVTAWDAAGNQSASGPVLAFDIDTVAPLQPTAPDMTYATDTGVSGTDNNTRNMQPVFLIKGEPFSIVNLVAIGETVDVVATGSVNSAGQILLTPSVPFVHDSFIMRAGITDKAGNIGPSSAGVQIFTSNVPPATPGTPVLAQVTDSGIPGDNITNTPKPIVSGTQALPNSTVAVNLFAGIFQYNVSTTTDAFGNWSTFAPVLPNGVYDVRVATTDIRGNTATSATLKLTIDTTPPATPLVADLVSSSDKGYSDTDNLTTGGSQTFVGTSQPNAKVDVFNNGSLLTTAHADGTGNWSVDALLKAGPFQIASIEYDAAGNASKLSPPLAGMVDLTTPLATFTTPPLTFASKFPTLSGTAEDDAANGDATGIHGASLEIRRSADGKIWNGTAWGILNDTELPTVFAGGIWTKSTGFPTGALALDGEYQVILHSYDTVGNPSLVKSIIVTLDNALPTVAITAPAVNAVVKTLSVVNGSSADQTSGVAKVELSLKRNLDGKFWNGAVWGIPQVQLPATLGATGFWTRITGWPAGVDAVNGAYSITALSTDKAGLTASAVRAFTINSAAAANLTASTPVVKTAQGAAALSTSHGSAKDCTVTLVFMTKLGAGTASEIANYSARIGNEELPIESATVRNSNEVVLLFANQIQAGEKATVDYDLIDSQGNAVSGSVTTLVSAQ